MACRYSSGRQHRHRSRFTRACRVFMGRRHLRSSRGCTNVSGGVSVRRAEIICGFGLWEIWCTKTDGQCFKDSISVLELVAVFQCYISHFCAQASPPAPRRLSHRVIRIASCISGLRCPLLPPTDNRNDDQSESDDCVHVNRSQLVVARIYEWRYYRRQRHR